MCRQHTPGNAPAAAIGKRIATIEGLRSKIAKTVQGAMNDFRIENH